MKVINFVDITKNNKKKTKVVDFVNDNNNRTLVIGFSNCGKTYLRNHFKHQKQGPILLNTKSLNQYPITKFQKSD